MSEAYTAGELSEEDYTDAVDVVMEEESTAGKSMLEGDPLSRRQGESGVQYSIANTRHMQWGKQVRSYFSGDKTIKSSDSLYLGESAVDGVQNSPRYVPTSVITKAVRTPKGSRSAHALTEADIMKLEEGINNAPVVIHNPTRNAIVYVTANQDSAGNYIVATFDLNNELYGENAHKATSVHGHKNLAGLLENLGEDATVFVKNENKLNQMLPGNQILKSLELLAKVELDGGSVAQNSSAVKREVPGMIPHEKYSFTSTPESGILPAAEPTTKAAADNLPTKAANALNRAENAMVRALEGMMGTSVTVQRDQLKPVVRQISEEYRRTGNIGCCLLL